MNGSVTIIGAGIVGICCALSLQERGIAVRLIDKGDPGQATSFGNAGVVSPWSIIPQAMPGIWKKIPGMLLGPDSALSVRPSFWPQMIPWGLRFLSKANENSLRTTSDAMEVLCRPSIELYRRHLRGTDGEDLITDSYYVHVFRQADKGRLDSLDYRLRTEKGGQLELIGRDALQQLEPALSPDFAAAVVIKNQARITSPGNIGKTLAAKAACQGAEFIRAEIRQLKRDEDGRWLMKTESETLIADRVVMAAGVWSANLLKPLGISVPLVAERGYHVEFPHPSVGLTNSVMDVDAKIVASSMLGGLRIAGSAEFASIDAPPDPRKQAALVRQASAMLPDLSTNETKFWMGRRPSFPDSLPAIGEIDGTPGLFAAFGHSHYGLMMAPKTGELVADLMSGRPSNIDLTALHPSRF
ncbi:MAG: FAD-binding oxidoreductase [Paracoccaceae bacterium]